MSIELCSAWAMLPHRCVCFCSGPCDTTDSTAALAFLALPCSTSFRALGRISEMTTVGSKARLLIAVLRYQLSASLMIKC